MKKILVIFVLLLSVVLIGNNKIGAKMNSEITQVRASHILVATEKEALDLKSKIEKGELDFETAAAQYSECPSGARGGDLGYFGRGMMVKEFEGPSFEGEINAISEPIQTQFGWHLIKVIDKK